MTPPDPQQRKIVPEECSCAATVAATRKMPLPMAMPTDTATVCSRLTERGMRSPHWSAMRHRESFCEQLDPMDDRHRSAAADVRQAADAGRGDELRRAALEGGGPGTQHPLRQLPLPDGIRARRAA